MVDVLSTVAIQSVRKHPRTARPRRCDFCSLCALSRTWKMTLAPLNPMSRVVTPKSTGDARSCIFSLTCALLDSVPLQVVGRSEYALNARSEAPGGALYRAWWRGWRVGGAGGRHLSW